MAGSMSFKAPSQGNPFLADGCSSKRHNGSLLSPWRTVLLGKGISSVKNFSRTRQKQVLEVNAIHSYPLTSPRPWRISEIVEFLPRQTQRYCVPQSRDTPPKRDTGIASEKEWGINLKNEKGNESGVNEDGSTWYIESGEDLGENGYRCRWTVMGGRSADGLSEWKEAVCQQFL